ncbi:hypothetical protein COCNU_11G000650 [Cocos nucifera]|uniref:Uncharacterized protein n=1 Tax=Cocos nucifera TaxID=13894 RepID=A0A8K0INI8_COCNU|nr:hypothetical protein COCNU_11G000650 [Cocos nucifera]
MGSPGVGPKEFGRGVRGVRLHGLAWGRSEGVRLAVGVRPLGSSARTLAQGSSASRQFGPDLGAGEFGLAPGAEALQRLLVTLG